VPSKRIFLDVNAVVDLLVATRTNHLQSKELIKHLSIHEYEIIISEDMLSTIFFIVKDKAKVLEFFRVIQKRWVVAPFGKNVIDEAIKLSLEKNLDFEDILQCLCAKANGCQTIITSDKSFYDCGIEVVDTDGFMNNIVKKRE